MGYRCFSVRVDSLDFCIRSKLGSRTLGQMFPRFRPASVDRVMTWPSCFAIISYLDLPSLVCVSSTVAYCVHQSLHILPIIMFKVTCVLLAVRFPAPGRADTEP